MRKDLEGSGGGERGQEVPLRFVCEILPMGNTLQLLGRFFSLSFGLCDCGETSIFFFLQRATQCFF